MIKITYGHEKCCLQRIHSFNLPNNTFFSICLASVLSEKNVVVDVCNNFFFEMRIFFTFLPFLHFEFSVSLKYSIMTLSLYIFIYMIYKLIIYIEANYLKCILCRLSNDKTFCLNIISCTNPCCHVMQLSILILVQTTEAKSHQQFSRLRQICSTISEDGKLKKKCNEF